MKGIAATWVFILICSFVLSSCKTGGCPNCVNPKPEYYNASKARDARHMKRQNKSLTATGGAVDAELEPNVKKQGRSHSRKPDPQTPILK
jgi:hypothetical protein